LDYVGPNSFVDLLSRVAILVFLFLAGLETSILEIKRGGKNAFYVGSIGIVSPMVVGLITAGGRLDFCGIGKRVGVVDDGLFSAVVILPMITTFLAPLTLRWMLGSNAA
jgi:Sodium/hydrogen exchanger family